MKVFIPTFGRASTISTHLSLQKAGIEDYLVVVHDQAQRAEYLKNPTIDPERLHVSDQPRGVTHQRNYIAKALVPFGQWYASMDDNVRDWQGVRPDLYPRTALPVQQKGFDRQVFEHRLGPGELRARMQQDRDYAERNGIFYVGYATVPNFYFLGKKRRHVGYVISKAVLIFNQRIGYDPKLEAMEDFGFCAEQHLRNGRVLINNWCWPVAGHYEPGGIGTYAERTPRKQVDCAYLLKKYPGFFRYKNKAGCAPQAELALRFTSERQVQVWRSEMRAGRVPPSAA